MMHLSMKDRLFLLIGISVYEEVMKAAGRMFFYNRCNDAKEEPFAQGWPDGDNFSQDTQTRYIYDQENTALEKRTFWRMV